MPRKFSDFAKFPSEFAFLETIIIGLHFATDSMGLFFIQIFFLIGSVKLFYFGHSRLSNWIVTNRKHIYDFLLVCRSNLGSILHCFRDIPGFLCLWLHPYSTLFWGCSPWTRLPMLGSIRAHTLSYLALAVKLFLKYCNLCDHSTWMSQTDGRQTT